MKMNYSQKDKELFDEYLGKGTCREGSVNDWSGKFEYTCQLVDAEWHGWQAARARLQLPEKAYLVVPDNPDVQHQIDGWNKAIEEVKRLNSL